MATAIASVQSTSSSTPDVTATHPSGLAAGDMLIAGISSITGGSNSHSFSTPSGWTKIGTPNDGANNNTVLLLFAKVAEASDVSAGSTAFTATGTTAEMDNTIAILARVTGTNGFTSPAVNVVYSGGVTNDYPTHTFTGLTSISTETLLLLFSASEITDGDINFSGYAVATDNPTWTEQADVHNEPSGVANNAALASASYPYKQATGNVSVTVDADGGSIASGLVAITENINVTVTPTTLALAATLNAPTMSSGVNFTPNTFTVAPTFNSVSPSGTAPTTFSNKSKNSTTWTNQNKSL